LLGAYFLTIYCFALIYGLLSMMNHSAFDSPRLPLLDAMYMSLTTATTIGSEIHPRSPGAKLIVMAQLIVCLAYAVMFFSLVATVIRDPGKTNRSQSGPNT
jgi:hypothetical protein